MNFNIDFNLPSAFKGNDYTRIHTSATEKAPPIATEHSNTKDAVISNVSASVKAEFLKNSADAPLSDAELEQLFTVYTKLGDESPLLGDIGRILTELSGNNRSNFLSVISLANDELEDVIYRVKEMEEDDRSLFLKTAVRIGSGEILAGLTKALKNIDPQTRTQFLETADTLGRSVESLKTNELQNFILAAAHSPKVRQALIDKTIDLEAKNRSDFLTAAAGAGKELENLISTTDSISEGLLDNFLKAAAGSGKGLNDLISLTNSLVGKERSAFLSFAVELSDDDLENFLVATQGDTKNLDRLISVTQTLAKEERSLFLNLGAQKSQFIGRLMDTVQNFDTETGGVHQFLSASIKAGDKFNQFLGITESLSGEDRFQIVSFASDLSFPDLASFIKSVKNSGSDAIKIVETGSMLGGKEKSYFLYAASLIEGDKEPFLSLTRNLEGSDRKNFLYLAANMQDNLTNFVDTIENLKNEDQTAYLKMAKKSLSHEAQDFTAREYVFLNAAFDDKTVEMLLGAGTKIESLLTRIDELDTQQRKTFVSVAKRAGKELMPSLLSVTGKLTEDENEQFMTFASGIFGENLKNFILASQTALEGKNTSHVVFSKFISMAEKLSEPVLEDFLNSAANAGKSLESLIDMTDQLGDMRRIHFLIATDDIAELSNSESLMNTFIKGTQNVIERVHDRFIAESILSGRRPSSIISGNALIGTAKFPLSNTPSPYSIDDFLKSAAWVSGIWGGQAMMADWVESLNQ